MDRQELLDRAGKEYWDAVWSARETDRRALSRPSYVDRQLLRLFRQLGLDGEGGRKRLLEIGAARSTWLAYFAREFGFSVVGIDYSPDGCDQARALLAAAGVNGEVICADALSPPSEMFAAYDVVVSFGVVEHFSDTAACLSAFMRFAAPGGMLLTVVPNMHGVVGFLQKVLNPAVYDIHVPITPRELAEAHVRAGLVDVQCRYFVTTHFGVPNLNRLRPGWATRTKRVLLTGLVAVSKAVWVFELVTRTRLPATRTFSPLIVCTARRPR